MKLIKFTSILLCFLMVAAVFAGCDTPEESKADVSSKDSLLQNSEDISETVSEEVLEEVSEVLEFIIIDKRDERDFWDDLSVVLYRDDTYKYYFSGSPMHEYVIVEYADGTTQNVLEAFQAGNITIADLDRFNIVYWKSPVD